MDRLVGPNPHGASTAQTYGPDGRMGSAGVSAKTIKKFDEAGHNFESMFMSQMMQFMWTDTEVNSDFGGGRGEEVWRGMLINEFGDIAGKTGGLGLADTVKTEMLRMQAEHNKAMQQASAPQEHVQEAAQNTVTLNNTPTHNVQEIDQ